MEFIQKEWEFRFRCVYNLKGKVPDLCSAGWLPLPGAGPACRDLAFPRGLRVGSPPALLSQAHQQPRRVRQRRQDVGREPVLAGNDMSQAAADPEAHNAG